MKLLIGLLALIPTVLTAQTTPAAPPAQAQAAPAVAPKPATVRVALTTEMGPIMLELESERAPVTTANFLRYVKAKRFDGIGFYRAMKITPTSGLVQAGQRDGAKLYPPIAHEPTSKTGLRHVDGTISMARGAPGSAVSDWFILVGDMPSLDADPQAPGDNLGFAAFGRVVEGMDVVRRIMEAPTDPEKGEGVMKGQMLSPVVKITTAKVMP